MDNDWVVMAHPELPNQPIRVHREAATVHELSGWKIDKKADLDKMTREEFIEKFGYDPES
jgi:hypothetical protein